MGLVTAMLFSIGIKAIAALIEIIIQMLITNRIGVSGYGDYAFFVSFIEFIYFFAISGSIKLNTFYLSTDDVDISLFKKKYRLRFVAPLLTSVFIISIVLRSQYGCIAAIVLLFYYLAYDKSSVFLSKGHQLPALIGEYILSRSVMLIGLVVCLKIGKTSGLVLLSLYGFQFVIMLAWFLFFENRLQRGLKSVPVSLRKLWEYQKSDIATALISYSPTILQYVIGGAFTAGFTGIITIVKKCINFISGPTAKVFLPEFSRLYKSGEKEQLKKSYLMIVRVQMVFIGTIGALLIGFPKYVLKMFNSELIPYAMTFTIAAVCLLFIAGIGPVTGLLQMTGGERICNINQWISIGVMIIVWLVFHNTPLFAVYGLASQAVIEGVLKYYSVCRWFKQQIIPIKSYIILWLPVCLIRVLVELFSLHYSLVALIPSVLFVFAWNSIFALRDPMVKKVVHGVFNRGKK